MPTDGRRPGPDQVPKRDRARPYELFISHAHASAALKGPLQVYLAPLRRAGCPGGRGRVEPRRGRARSPSAPAMD